MDFIGKLIMMALTYVYVAMLTRNSTNSQYGVSLAPVVLWINISILDTI